MKHAAFDPEARRVRRDAVREVAGGGAGEHLEAELDRPGRRDRDDAVLVGQRRMVDRVVLDVELADAEPVGQPSAAHQRREAGIEAGARLAGDRQQLAIAPQVLRPLLDLLARQVDGAVVVDRLERPETLVADVDRFGRKRRLTEMALQSDQRAHTASASTELRIVNLELRIGAGTMAALSRAIAAMSPSTATAVASPPAPAPKMPISPECAPVISAAFCGAGGPAEDRTAIDLDRRDPRGQRRRRRGRSRRTRSAGWSRWRCRARAKSPARDGRRRPDLNLCRIDAQPERQRAENRELGARVAAVEIGGRDRPRRSRGPGHRAARRRACSRSPPSATAPRWSCRSGSRPGA